MILTCPECASRYFVDDSKVGSAGRVVRCASCGNRWTARNEEANDLFDEPEAPTLASQLDSAEQIAGAGAETDEPPVSALPGEELPKVFRARADAERRLREATATGVIWAGMAAAMAVVVVAALIFRIDVVRIMPGSAGAYAAVGLPVNTVGLVIDRDSIKALPLMQDGHAAVTITGSIRNITEHEVVSPPLRVELLGGGRRRQDPARPGAPFLDHLPRSGPDGQGPADRLRHGTRRGQGGEDCSEKAGRPRRRARIGPAWGPGRRRRA
jgi:predicted Zn finger-like uncharacterized protein